MTMKPAAFHLPLLSIHRLPPPPTVLCSLLPLLHLCCLISALPHQLGRGFSARPRSDPPPLLSSSSSSLSFQPILDDPTGNFSLGFILVPPSTGLLDLAVVHLPSALPVWRASPAAPARWSDSAASLTFDGSLILSATGGVLWSSGDSTAGDRLVLLSSSNLQIQEASGSVVWQSFNFPSDTLVQGQNFSSSASLFSADRRYSMRLGTNFLALYMVPNYTGVDVVMYWQVTALEERAEIVEGGGPIYARVDPVGYLGLYQTEKTRVHLMPFDTFERNVLGFRRLTIETDGNLHAYYWNSSSWVRDFTAISNVCNLPAHCGSYGVCTKGKEACGCLDEGRTSDRCLPAAVGSLCGDKFWELRTTGVELSYMETLNYQKTASLDECERGCQGNCSCWGALYNNATGSCYRMGFPVETLLSTGDHNRMGYFKVRGDDRRTEGKKRSLGGFLLVLLIGLPLFVGVALFVAYRKWEHRRRAAGGLTGEEISPGPYKVFKDSASFRAIELSMPSSSSSPT